MLSDAAKHKGVCSMSCCSGLAFITTRISLHPCSSLCLSLLRSVLIPALHLLPILDHVLSAACPAMFWGFFHFMGESEGRGCMYSRID